jgi:hypothetical protein
MHLGSHAVQFQQGEQGQADRQGGQGQINEDNLALQGTHGLSLNRPPGHVLKIATSTARAGAFSKWDGKDNQERENFILLIYRTTY